MFWKSIFSTCALNFNSFSAHSVKTNYKTSQSLNGPKAIRFVPFNLGPFHLTHSTSQTLQKKQTSNDPLCHISDFNQFPKNKYQSAFFLSNPFIFLSKTLHFLHFVPLFKSKCFPLLTSNSTMSLKKASSGGRSSRSQPIPPPK